MKKSSLLFFSALAFVCVVLLSWGVTGHRTVGEIAENHLTPKALAGVHDLLGDQSLADVSTWADEVRGKPEYRQTGSWHFLNLPLGLSYAEFTKQVEGMEQANVYSALLQQEKVLADKEAPREKRVEALKFVVHFVGDLHQPMHISRAEDKGGNTIQVNYDGAGTNLHSLWDTKLLEHQGLTYDQLAEKYDHMSPAQIRQWQADPLIKWIWESYEISSRLYAEVDAMKSRNIDEAYYQAHLPIIQERIEQAGIRLAGVLNELFKDGPAPGDRVAAGAAGQAPSAAAGASAATGGTSDRNSPAAKTIDIHDAANHVDEYVTVCAPVYGYKALESMTLVNLGAAYPDQLLTLVLREGAKDIYKSLDGQTVCVTGTIVLYKEKPEIVVTDPGAVVVQHK